jgi:hypothetical protein
MGAQILYEDVLTKAETLPPEELSKLIGELSKFLYYYFVKVRGFVSSTTQ